VRSTTDTSVVGTRKAIPVSFPFSSGSTLPTALAAPVALGMMLVLAVRPPRQSLFEGPSTVFCVAENEKEKENEETFRFQISDVKRHVNTRPVRD